MGMQEELHEMRQRAHDAGIQGSSKMTMEQLRNALKKVGKGMEPMVAKRQSGR